MLQFESPVVYILERHGNTGVDQKSLPPPLLRSHRPNFLVRNTFP